MKHLITIKEEKKGKQMVDARELHSKLMSKQQFADWIKKRIQEYQFVEDEDFVTIHKIVKRKKGSRGASKATEYAITLDMAKELAMVERTAAGKQIRNYFIAVEKAARSQMLVMPKTISVNHHTCYPYTYWLLQHGYSVRSGSYHRRIQRHRAHFVKENGQWYISEDLAHALVRARRARQRIAEVVPLAQMGLDFSTGVRADT